MAYTPSTLCLTTEAPLTGARQTWVHASADAAAAVDTAGFISDADARGVLVGDIVRHTDTGSGVVTSHRVAAITAGAADLSDGVIIGLATNTD